jgi:hypothetical protein
MNVLSSSSVSKSKLYLQHVSFWLFEFIFGPEDGSISAYESSVSYRIARGHVPKCSILEEITYLEEDYIDYGKGNVVIMLYMEEIHNLYSPPDIIRVVQ